MSFDSYRISIEVVENGFVVEVPDLDAIAERKAKAKKSKQPEPSYFGDCSEKYAAKSANEVVRLVKTSLEKIASKEYDQSFKEASEKSS